MKKLKAAVARREQLIETLRANPKVARDYLAAAIKDTDSRVLLAALRTVVEARSLPRVGEKTGVPHQGLYRTLSVKGDTRLATLLAVLKATGFQFSLEERKGRTIQHSPAASAFAQNSV